MPNASRTATAREAAFILATLPQQSPAAPVRVCPTLAGSILHHAARRAWTIDNTSQHR